MLQRSVRGISLPAVAILLMVMCVGCGSDNNAGSAPGAPPGNNPPPGGGGNVGAPTFLYVGNLGDGTISGYRVETNGTLSALPMSPFSTQAVGFTLDADEAGRFLFSSGPGMGAFAIDGETGVLSAIAGMPVAVVGFTETVKVHPSGGFVYVSDVNGRQVFGFAVDSTIGALSAVPGSPSAVGGTNAFPFGIAIHGSGRFLYTANAEANDISGFAIDASTGSLSAVAGSPFGVGQSPLFCPPPTNFCGPSVAAAGDLLYQVDPLAPGAVAGFRIDLNTGALIALPGSPFTNPAPNTTGATGIAVAPSGNFLFIVNNGSIHSRIPAVQSSVSVFQLDPATGALGPVPGSPFAAGMGSLRAAISRNGRFLFVTNIDDDTVSAYAVDGSTGVLTAVPGSPFRAGHQPAGIAIVR